MGNPYPRIREFPPEASQHAPQLQGKLLVLDIPLTYSQAMANQQIDYVELPGPQFEATKEFYSRAFGWDWTQYGPTYAAFEGGPVEVGLNGEAAPAPQHAPGAENAIGPFALLRCDDLEAAQSDVVAAGGEIISAIYPYPGGRRFHFADPSGNIVGVYQPDPIG